MSTVGLFGRQFTEVGSNSSDFLIKTKGKVKIQWGNKFIDLIKDGKIAVDGFQFHTAKDKESISGEDGFYITDDGGVYIKFGNSEPINIFGEVGTTYVSFIAEQETLPEQKTTAQKNIGLIFDTLKDAQNANLQTGIVFIADEGKLYAIKDSLLEDLKFDIPTPYTKKIVLQVDQGESCSLLIDGYYDQNKHCIVIGKEGAGLYLYSSDSEGVVQSKVRSLVLETGDGNQILIEEKGVTIKPVLICNSIHSIGATASSGYRLYTDNSQSTLEIDNLILRNGFTPQAVSHGDLLDMIAEERLVTNNYYLISDFQNEWELTAYKEIVEGGDNLRPLLVKAISDTQLDKKAVMISNPDWDIEYDVLYQDTIKVKTSSGEEVETPARGRITMLRDEYNNQCNYDFKHLQFQINDQWIYTFGGTNDTSLDGTAHDNTIIVDNYNIQSTYSVIRAGAKVSLQGETHNNTIRLSSDYITSDPFINNVGTNLENCIIQGPLSNTCFHGSFINQVFSSTDNPELGQIDKFTDVYMNGAEVKIVCIPDLVAPGTIVMFNGSGSIPVGWAVCDGTNGTPDLVGNFIVGSTTAGNISGYVQPASLQTELKYYSLIFIMKL